MTAARPLRSPCPIAGTLDVVGDRWTLLVVRDLLLRGAETFSELAANAEGISTNVLTERLRRLEAAGIVERQPYRRRPLRHRYRLTEKGEALRPVLAEMRRWGERHLPGTHANALDPTGAHAGRR